MIRTTAMIKTIMDLGLVFLFSIFLAEGMRDINQLAQLFGFFGIVAMAYNQFILNYSYLEEAESDYSVSINGDISEDNVEKFNKELAELVNKYFE